MNNTILNKTELHCPLDIGKKTIKDIFEIYKNPLMALTFISTFSLKKTDEYSLPNQNKFLFQMWNKTFMIEISKTKITVSLKANFVVLDVKECSYIYNDKSGTKPLKYYLAVLKNFNGKIEKDVEIANNSKSDYKQFQSDINSRYNDFAINMTESEFKTFVAEYISPKVASIAYIYTNAGVLEQGKILYENALATSKGIVYADENGYIPIGQKRFIKLAESTHYLPKLAKSIRSGKEIAKDFIENVLECWSDNKILPLVTLGHMAMSIYYEQFIKSYGVPTLILFGETGTGKSTLATVCLSMFGLSRDALTSGGSTAKSNEYFSSKYNGMCICIDDVKGHTLNSSNFTALVKGAYKGIPRTRMKAYGKGVEYIHSCSPVAYSTNESLPNLQEVVNRLTIVEMFGKTFKADSFKYHEGNSNSSSNLNELSLILPELLKYPFNEVVKIYNSIFDDLNSKTKDTQKRVINNLAYAYTGITLLLDIAGVQIDNLSQILVEYTKKQISNYETVQNVVDKVLTEIPVLYELEYLKKDSHFRIGRELNSEGKEELQIRFNKGIVLSIINKYYAHDKSKQINSDLFTSYAKNHPRYRGNKSVRYDNYDKKPSHSVCFFIGGIDEYSDFGSIPTPISAVELKDRLKGNSP